MTESPLSPSSPFQPIQPIYHCSKHGEIVDVVIFTRAGVAPHHYCFLCVEGLLNESIGQVKQMCSKSCATTTLCETDGSCKP